MMRLPDSFLDDLRNRLSLSAVVGRKVTWDMKKTNQAKGDWWAPCPFHQEKSASFHVDDQKGFYYCFGCQAKGNVFGFVQETENVGFMEAVEILAGEAGMPMPARDPKAAEKSDLRTRLAEVTEEAVKWFRLQLATGAASDARAYLDLRGLTRETLNRFEIGFAPDASDAFLRAMADKGIPFDMLEGAGLAVPAEDGRAARDRFIHRIIFPIRDVRGRCIGFGGRAMNPNAKAKYLNSPETPLFDKGSNLYNLRDARAAAGKGQPLVVAEGYMDVIALAQAGFEAAVAPLGTAVTERQLQMLWRVTPEPLIALDGDAAGQRAGLRVADLALPLIEAGQSLRFAVLPEGKDPDDLIRDAGPRAMRAVLDDAKSMLSLLWKRETEGKSFDSPERRAMLDRDLRAVLRRIKDASLRRHYAEEVARLRAELFGIPLTRAPVFDVPPAPPTEPDRVFVPNPAYRRDRPWTPGQKWKPPAQATTTARASALASGSTTPDLLLEQVILAGLIRHPELIAEFTDLLEGGTWGQDEHVWIGQALLAADAGLEMGEMLDILEARIGTEALETLLAQRHVRISPVTRGDGDAARLCIRDATTRLEARRAKARETREAEEDFEDGAADEAMTWRLAEAGKRQTAAMRPREDDTATGEEETSFADYYDSLLATPAGKSTTEK
ncbi:DNA primase [Jannaschia donghaensis]|uniref:DNA primase n=2 Tax=Jannaschia donghaensis TaxID=420998 RepID=A0A0M6YLR7_9RHOB|nr:DNA primase [Jannaschia donghaensis]CTQ49996.1 DNA primase [Jannaschia donghaensis]